MSKESALTYSEWYDRFQNGNRLSPCKWENCYPGMEESKCIHESSVGKRFDKAVDCPCRYHCMHFEAVKEEGDPNVNLDNVATVELAAELARRLKDEEDTK